MADTPSVDLAKLGLSGGGGGGGDQAEAKMEAEDQRRMMLTAIMTPAARERLIRLSLVKADKARAVEDHFLSLARSGKMQTQVDEVSVIAVLERLEGSADKGTKKVVIMRRRGADADDADDNDDDLM